MDILIPDNWLREFLKTTATPQKLASCLSLSGPAVEKVQKGKTGPVYSIEVTTNRVDSAGVYGIAREAAAVLPRFGVKTELQPIKLTSDQPLVKSVDYLDADVDHNLCKRFTAILIQNVKVKPSEIWMQNRLADVGIRPLNNIIDISNYIMVELGQPTHTFDYDKIQGSTMILRQSKADELITTLNGKTYSLAGGDIVIEDGQGRLIDLAGIMGGQNSAIDSNTKNVLFFVQHYNPANIRKTSMALGVRTAAASLFEKDVDTGGVETAVRRGIDLFGKLGGEPAVKILDLYPKPYTTKTIRVTTAGLKDHLGVEIPQNDINKILSSLGFTPKWSANTLAASVPSFRSNDIAIPEDIVEEVARIYGYHNLPSQLPAGSLPEKLSSPTFDFERKLKELLRGLGGTEVYTCSLVSKNMASLQGYTQRALRIKNPLGPDSEYLRLSLAPSLAAAAAENLREAEPFHLFEVANVYLARKNNLPEESLMLGGVLTNYSFGEARGVVDELLAALGIKAQFEPEDSVGFLPLHRLSINSGKQNIGELGTLNSGYCYYEFEIATLSGLAKPTGSYQPPPKYPAQVEDITLVVPAKTYLGLAVDAIKKSDKNIVSVKLIDTYKNTQTVRISYQNPNKTLTDKEVENIRIKILKNLKTKFGVRAKS